MDSIEALATQPREIPAKRSHLTPEGKERLRQANLGRHPSPETRAKMSAAKKGKPLSPEHRRRISEANTGRPRTSEHQANLTEAIRARARDPEYGARIAASKRGKPRSPETRAKISAALRGIPTGPRRLGHHLAPEHRAKLSEAMKRWVERHPHDLAKRRRNRKRFEFTRLERAVMGALDQFNIRYLVQKPVGPYCVDIFLLPNIVLECDGHYWHSKPNVAAKDRKRDDYMRGLGLVVIRLHEDEIDRNPVGAVLRAVDELVQLDKEAELEAASASIEAEMQEAI